MLHTVPKCFCFGRDEAPPHHLLTFKAKNTQLSWFCSVVWSWSPNMCVTVTTVSLSTIKERTSSPVSGSRSGFLCSVFRPQNLHRSLELWTNLLVGLRCSVLVEVIMASARQPPQQAAVTGAQFVLYPFRSQQHRRRRSSLSSTSQVTLEVIFLTAHRGLQRFGLPAQSSC